MITKEEMESPGGLVIGEAAPGRIIKVTGLIDRNHVIIRLSV